jgi:CRISPR system Cascade subunit CasC
MHVDIHALQSVPYSNLNRDAQGAPKETVYGGKTRTRVSSQSWKRAVRLEMERQIGDPTIRTRQVAGAVRDALVERGWDDDSARKAGRAVMFSADGIAKRSEDKNGGVAPDDHTDLSKVLFWIPRSAIAELAELCHEHRDVIAATTLPSGEGSGNGAGTGTGKNNASKAKRTKADKTKAEIVLPSAEVDQILRRRSPTINLFGRMLAEMPGHGVDGATLFAHAFTTHETAVDFDFFTAVDDITAEDSTGSGHLATAEFASGVFYRYSSVNITDLARNIGTLDDALTTLGAYLGAFCSAIPSGKQKTTAAITVPELVHIAVRHQPLSLAGAFEKPVRSAADGGHAEPSRRLLAEYSARLHRFIGHGGLVWHGHASIDEHHYSPLGERSDTLPDLIATAMTRIGNTA